MAEASNFGRHGMTKSQMSWLVLILGALTGCHDQPNAEQTYTVNLVAQPVGGGAISLNPAGGTYVAGTMVEVRAIPASGYAFSEWSGDLSGAVNPLRLTVDTDKSVTATFSSMSSGQFVLQVDALPSDWGSVTLTPPGGVYNPGTTVTLTAAPNDVDVTLLTWGGDLSGTANPIQINMDSDKSVTANFDCTGYSFDVAVSHSDAGVVILDPPGRCYTDGTVVTLRAIPNPGYVFSEWIGYQITSGSVWFAYGIFGTDNPLQVTMFESTATIAVFRGTDRYVLDVSESSGGTVTLDPQPTNGAYDWNTWVTLTAQADSGYAFSGWDGDVTGIQQNPGLMMDGDKSVSASFIPLTSGQFTLTVVLQGEVPRATGSTRGGPVRVTANPPGGAYDPGTVVTLTATTLGYTWAGWSGDDDGSGSVTMDTDKMVTLFVSTSPIAICQAHKLLDNDPVVRMIAEELLLMMGTGEFAYMRWAASKARPELRRQIFAQMEAICGGAKPNPSRWPSPAECMQRLDHQDTVVAIMAAQMLQAIRVRQQTRLNPPTRKRIAGLLKQARLRNVAQRAVLEQ